MADSNDKATDKEKDQKTETDSDLDSAVNWEEKAKHFQSLADKRDADYKSLQSELDGLKAAQEKAGKEELEKKEKFQELYEGSEKKVAELEKQATSLDLRVKLQEHLADKAPNYAPDFRWIYPHVTSEEDIASVVEEYVKAHPKAEGVGAASMGNRGSEGAGQETISQADIEDPVKVAALLKKEPKLLEKIAAGEIKPI